MDGKTIVFLVFIKNVRQKVKSWLSDSKKASSEVVFHLDKSLPPVLSYTQSIIFLSAVFLSGAAAASRV